VRRAGIRLVMFFDVQPVAPFVRDLHEAGVPCVLSYWGSPISDPMPMHRLLLKRAGLALAGRSRVDGLIFESRAMAELAITGRGCPEHLLDVSPTGVDADQFHPATGKGHVHELFDVPRTRKVVIYSGHAHERKGMGPLMDAARILLDERRRDDLFLLVCGDGPGEAEPWQARIAGTEAERWVRFAGYRTDMPMLMRHSDIGVVPSSGWDSFPMSVLEMAACGLPVVATRLGGIPEGVLDGETGLLCRPGDARQLADALERLLDDPTLAARLGRHGRERIEREFTLDAHEERLVEIWRGGGGGPPPPRPPHRAA
jgi:glycosyltransferase involved in cell wall biosynthesis